MVSLFPGIWFSLSPVVEKAQDPMISLQLGFPEVARGEISLEWQLSDTQKEMGKSGRCPTWVTHTLDIHGFQISRVTMDLAMSFSELTQNLRGGPLFQTYPILSHPHSHGGRAALKTRPRVSSPPCV